MLAYSIYNKVQHEASLQQTKDLLRAAATGKNVWLVLLLFVLMIANWLTEAAKWKVLVSRVHEMHLFTAFKAVLSGLSLSMFVPNGIGDYAGRIVYMKEGNRLRSLSLTLVGSMAQLTVTLTAGFAGLIFLQSSAWKTAGQMQGLPQILVNGFIFMIGSGAVLMMVIFFKLRWLTIMFEKIPLVHKYRFLVKDIETISQRDLVRILALSITRYMVFIIQYLVVLHIFNVQLNIAEAIATTCVLFVVLAILPTIPVADLGMRGEAGLQLFGILTANSIGIIATTAAIWLLNLVFPAIAGSLFIIGIKIFRNR